MLINILKSLFNYELYPCSEELQIHLVNFDELELWNEEH